MRKKPISCSSTGRVAAILESRAPDRVVSIAGRYQRTAAVFARAHGQRRQIAMHGTA